MQGRKKVSDYMIDQKFTILQKEILGFYILTMKLCVCRSRLDDRFKLVAQTEKSISCPTLLKKKMSDKQSLFEEKQYLGYNKLSFLRRMVLALFCF